MTATWSAAVAIPVDVAEGPGSWEAVLAARTALERQAEALGVVPTFRLVFPPRAQGRPVQVGTCPITGDPIPSPYMFTATIQENQTCPD